jgi:hypothetical protein
MRKRLTVDNWCEPDSASTVFATLDEAGARPADGDDVVRLLLRRRLKTTVPLEVRELFDAAVGLGLYGWFYYPLFLLSADQLRRAADRAVQLRVRELDGPSTESFVVRIRWLHEQRVLNDDEQHGWTQTRLLRNEGSHPKDFQPVHTPIDLANVIGMLAERIETLWERGMTPS